jgi:integrase
LESLREKPRRTQIRVWESNPAPWEDAMKRAPRKPLTDILIRSLKPKDKPYKITDSEGLYLVVTPAGGKLWRVDYRFAGKRKTLSLGEYPYISLAEARQRRDEAKTDLAHGIDPALKKRAQREALKETFGAIALEWFERTKPTWAPGHADKTKSRLERWLLPWLKDVPIRQISAPLILECARRAESQGKLETAHRVVQIAGQIIRYAMATGRAESDPTPALRGALMPSPKKHYPAPTTPDALAEVLKAIWSYEGGVVVKAALQILALTFQRPGEVRHMKWGELDFEAKQWRFTVSKTKTEHLVPLSIQALEVIEGLRPLTGSSPYVFASLTRRGRPISNMTMNRALQIMGFSTRDEITSHGFRSAARTLLHEHLKCNPDVIEHQLAHRVPDRLGQAYNRTRFLEERRMMMQRWADYLDRLRTGQESKVVPFPNSRDIV